MCFPNPEKNALPINAEKEYRPKHIYISRKYKKKIDLNKSEG